MLYESHHMANIEALTAQHDAAVTGADAWNKSDDGYARESGDGPFKMPDTGCSGRASGLDYLATTVGAEGVGAKVWQPDANGEHVPKQIWRQAGGGDWETAMQLKELLPVSTPVLVRHVPQVGPRLTLAENSSVTAQLTWTSTGSYAAVAGGV
jgi:hypothetical protein